MFPDKLPNLSDNNFMKAWKENSKLASKLLGAPPFLRESFSSDWLEQIKEKIGDGPLTPYTLAQYSDIIENLIKYVGHERIINKLKRLDDSFFATISELSFLKHVSLLNPQESIHLEYTFKTAKDKHPELMVDYEGEPVYFEVTSVYDYSEMDEILNLYNLLTAFRFSFQILYGWRKEIKVIFNEYPVNGICDKIKKTINDEIWKQERINIVFKSNDFDVIISPGDEVVFIMPDEIIEYKIKDKLDGKNSQFDDGNMNYVVLDITSIIIEKEKIIDMVKCYFDYTKNEKLWGVVIMYRGWDFDPLPVYTYTVSPCINPNINKEFSKKVIEKMVLGKVS